MQTPDVDSTKTVTGIPITFHNMYRRFGKRAVDVLASMILLALLVIPIVMIALLIVLDTPGNPLFLQTRIGKNGRSFRMWKLRTMVSSSDKALMYWEDEQGRRTHKVKSDPRITRVGRLLRRTSLDELPQFVNVLVGQMSLVGPRPELPEIVALYQPNQHKRHQVVPGITGLWQVSGRSSLPMHENTDLDIFYVENQSLELDLEILRKTVSSVWRGAGAF